MHMNKYQLSPSTIGLMLACPRCFWLHMHKKQKRPRGIYPSLPSGMDLVIKKYFDKYRGSLPPELVGKVRGVLFEDSGKLNRWRYWKTSLTYQKENTIVYGAFDDLLRDGEIYIPLDYKTRGSPPKDDTLGYYLHQLDIYTLLLDANGYQTDSEAYLVYYHPREVLENGIVKFEVLPEKVETDVERAKRLVGDAMTVLEGPEPESHEDCEYCNYIKYFSEFDEP